MSEDTHEFRISLLERQATRIDDSLQKLAEDMHKLTGFSIQQAEDRSALRRAFDQIDVLDSKVDGLKSQFDASILATLADKNAEQQKRLDEERSSRLSVLGDILKTALMVIGALIVGHLGGKMLSL